MSLLNVKCSIRGRGEFTCCEPDTRAAGARFIAERGRDAGHFGFRRLREIVRRARDGEPNTFDGATYWIERF